MDLFECKMKRRSVTQHYLNVILNKDTDSLLGADSGGQPRI